MVDSAMNQHQATVAANAIAASVTTNTLRAIGGRLDYGDLKESYLLDASFLDLHRSKLRFFPSARMSLY